MMIAAFEHGIAAGLFNDELIRIPTETFFEVWERVVAHIEAEEVMVRKNDNSHLRQGLRKATEPDPCESTKPQPRRERTRGTCHM